LNDPFDPQYVDATSPLSTPSYCYLWHSCGQIFSRLALVFTGPTERVAGEPSRNYARGCFISCILRSPRCISAANVDNGYASHYAGRFPRVTYPIVSLTSRNCQEIASERKIINSFIYRHLVKKMLKTFKTYLLLVIHIAIYFYLLLLKTYCCLHVLYIDMYNIWNDLCFSQ